MAKRKLTEKEKETKRRREYRDYRLKWVLQEPGMIDFLDQLVNQRVVAAIQKFIDTNYTIDLTLTPKKAIKKK